MKRLIFRLMFGNSQVAQEAFTLLQLRRKVDALHNSDLPAVDVSIQACELMDYAITTAGEISNLVYEEYDGDFDEDWSEEELLAIVEELVA